MDANQEKLKKLASERAQPPLAELPMPSRTAPPTSLVNRPAPDRIRLPQAQAKPAHEPTGMPPSGVEQHLVSLLTPTSFEAEQYRTLRYMLEVLHKTDKLTHVAVSSATPADGKTTTAINLAGTLAQAPEARVLLVEADIRRPSIASYLGQDIATGPGLVGAIQNSALTLDKVVLWRPKFNLSILPAGRPTAVPYDVLKSPRLEKLLAEARERYDYVVLDMPPLVPIPDCRILSKLVDGFLVVVAAHKTPRRLLAEALTVLDPAKVLGIVFNHDDRLLAGYYDYYASYYVQSHKDKNNGWWGRMTKKVGGPSRR